MHLVEALATALTYERKVYAHYAEAAAHAQDPNAAKVFELLAREEAGHVAYLESRIEEWQKHGHLSEQPLQTAVPSPEAIARGMARLRAQFHGIADPVSQAHAELEYLKRALALENETFAFYQQVVGEVSDERKILFERFLEIERAHGAIVQAQIDAVTGMGFWFDIQEFTLEAG